MIVSLDQIERLWWAYLTLNVERYLVFALATWSVLWIALSGLLKNRRIRAAGPPVRQMTWELLLSVRTVAVFATAGAAMNLTSRAGLYPLADVAAHWGTAWMWASLVLMIVGHDAYYYWTHRAMHHRRMFRLVHKQHHSSHNPSPFTAYSFDVAEAVILVSFVILWPLAVPTPWPVIQLFILHQIARNTLLHAGYELMPARADGRPMLDWLTTTTHHDLHHAKAGFNFGLYFTWWDRWMGTENPDYRAAFARAAGRPLLASAPRTAGARDAVLAS
jgi:sterol desaturase/sphingolipid hydroxylase (fatty acid hydroxylase superfamily)